MATKEWFTLSVKVTREQKNAIERNCQHENLTVNKFLSRVVAREIEPILNPTVLAENKGIPLVGDNKFRYIPEKDNFIWQLDLGVNGSAVLGEDFSLFYLENLKRAIDNGIEQRQGFHKKVKKGVVIPSKMIKYGVKKNVSD